MAGAPSSVMRRLRPDYLLSGSVELEPLGFFEGGLVPSVLVLPDDDWSLVPAEPEPPMPLDSLLEAPLELIPPEPPPDFLSRSSVLPVEPVLPLAPVEPEPLVPLPP